MVRFAHGAEAARRRDRKERQRQLQEEREAQAAHAQACEQAALLVQRCYRGFYDRRFVVPPAIAQAEARELESQRVVLASSLLNMYGVLHDLSFREDDRRHAAERIQSWWRGVLFRRVAKILILQRKLMRVATGMNTAVLQVQAKFRGGLARVGAQVLRSQQEERLLEERRRAITSKAGMAIRIQGAIRNFLAWREARSRRMARAQALRDEALAEECPPLVERAPRPKDDAKRPRRGRTAAKPAAPPASRARGSAG